MADESPARGRRSLTWLWMLLALVVVGGFLTWLGMTAEPTQVAVVEEEEEEDLAIPTIPKERLQRNKSQYAGQEIRIRDVGATTALGPEVYWLELGDQGNQIPLLARVDSATEDASALRVGGNYTVVGRLQPMSDSVAAAWAAAGAFTDESGELQASFADYYMQLTRVRPGAAAPAPTADTAAMDTAAMDTAGMDTAAGGR